MKMPTGDLTWEAIYQVVMAIVFFGFVLFGFQNGMSNTDIAMWIALASSSGLVSFVKNRSTKPAETPPSDGDA